MKKNSVGRKKPRFKKEQVERWVKHRLEIHRLTGLTLNELASYIKRDHAVPKEITIDCVKDLSNILHIDLSERYPIYYLK